MIPCKLKEKNEFGKIMPAPLHKRKKKKLGRYHSSFFYDVKGYSRDRWVILAEIEILEPETHLQDDFDIKQVTKKCIEYLNQPPKRKRKTKKKLQGLYGTLEYHKSQFKEDENGKQSLIVSLITDQRKNKYFSGEGPRATGLRRKRRRTRKIE